MTYDPKTRDLVYALDCLYLAEGALSDSRVAVRGLELFEDEKALMEMWDHVSDIISKVQDEMVRYAEEGVRRRRRKMNERMAVRPLWLLGAGIDPRGGEDGIAPQRGLDIRREDAVSCVQREIPRDDDGEVVQ